MRANDFARSKFLNRLERKACFMCVTHFQGCSGTARQGKVTRVAGLAPQATALNSDYNEWQIALRIEGFCLL